MNDDRWTLVLYYRFNLCRDFDSFVVLLVVDSKKRNHNEKTKGPEYSRET